MKSLILLLGLAVPGLGQRMAVHTGGTAPGTPTDSPGQGTYSGAQDVTLTDASANIIRYTTDGSTPSFTAGTLYTGVFSTGPSTITVKAIGCALNGNCGGVLTSVYTISGGASTWTKINQVSAEADGTITTAGIDTTGADLIYVWETIYYNLLPSAAPTDSKTNSWTQCGSDEQNANRVIAVWYTKPTSVGAAHTFTLTGQIYSSIEVVAWSGSKTSSPCDQFNGTATNSSSCQAGSITPTENNELLVAGVAAFPLASASLDTGFSLGVALFSTGHEGGSTWHLVQTTAGPINPTWTTDVAGICSIVSFKSLSP